MLITMDNLVQSKAHPMLRRYILDHRRSHLFESRNWDKSRMTHRRPPFVPVQSAPEIHIRSRQNVPHSSSVTLTRQVLPILADGSHFEIGAKPS